MDVEATLSDSHRAVVGESDHVDEADEIGSLDRLPSGYPQNAVPEESDPGGPEVVEQRLGHRRRRAASSSWGTIGESPKMEETGAPVCASLTAASALARWIASLTMAISAGLL